MTNVYHQAEATAASKRRRDKEGQYERCLVCNSELPTHVARALPRLKYGEYTEEDKQRSRKFCEPCRRVVAMAVLATREREKGGGC